MEVSYFRYVVVPPMNNDKLKLEKQLIDTQIENIKLKKEIEKLQKIIKRLREKYEK